MHRPVQLRLDSSNVNLERLRDLLEIHFGVETEPEDLALARRQGLLAGLERGHRLALHRSRLRPRLAVRQLGENADALPVPGLVHDRCRAAPPPQLVEARVDGYSGQPGREGRPAVEIADPGEGLDQAVLGRRIGLVDADVLAAHHPHPALVTVGQLAESVAVTVRRPHDEGVIPLGKIGSRRVHGSCSQHNHTTSNADFR